MKLIICFAINVLLLLLLVMIFSFFSLCRDLFFFKVGRAQTFERQQQRAERDGVEQAQKRRVSLAKKAFSVDNTLYQASIDIRTIISLWITLTTLHPPCLIVSII